MLHEQNYTKVELNFLYILDGMVLVFGCQIILKKTDSEFNIYLHVARRMCKYNETAIRYSI